MPPERGNAEYADDEQLWFDFDPDGEDALVQRQDASIGYRIAAVPTLVLHAREDAVAPFGESMSRRESVKATVPAFG